MCMCLLVISCTTLLMTCWNWVAQTVFNSSSFWSLVIQYEVSWEMKFYDASVFFFA